LLETLFSPAAYLRGRFNETWTTKTGRMLAGQVHDKSSAHKILHCRTYLGEMKHRDQYFENTHAPVIERTLWDEAHTPSCRSTAGSGQVPRAGARSTSC
jgi:site-specific DNA recombinase